MWKTSPDLGSLIGTIQLGLGGAFDDGDGIPIRESSLFGGKDVVDGDLLILVPVSVDAALVGAGAVLVGMFVHSS